MKRKYLWLIIVIVVVASICAILYVLFLMPIYPPTASWVCTPQSTDAYCIFYNFRRMKLAWWSSCTSVNTQTDNCNLYPVSQYCGTNTTHYFKCGCTGIDTFSNCNSAVTDCDVRQGSTDYYHIVGYGNTYGFIGDSIGWAMDNYKCTGGTWDFTVSCNPTVANNVPQGNSASTTVNILPNGGTPSSAITVTVSGLPSGWSTNWGLNTYTCAAGSSCVPTLTITTSAFTTPGSYIIGVSGTGGGKTRSDGFQINLVAKCTPYTCSQMGWACGSGTETNCGTAITCGSCTSPLTCNSNHQCVSGCTSTCSSGQTRCLDTLTPQICQLQSTGCYDWTSQATCNSGGGYYCVSGSCQSVIGTTSLILIGLLSIIIVGSLAILKFVVFA